MSHDFHGPQVGYSARQILHDGCAECKDRGRYPWLAIQHMDRARFEYAWDRAVKFERGELDDVCAAEVPVLRILWAIQLRFEERGIPIGRCPDVWDTQREVALP